MYLADAQKVSTEERKFQANFFYIKRRDKQKKNLDN